MPPALTKLLALAGASLLLLAAGYFIHQQDSRRGRKVVAEVAGQPIFEDELLARVRGELRDLDRQRFEIKRRALDELITERLLETEAQDHGLSIEELIRQRADAGVPMPPEESIRALYDTQRAQIGRPLEDVRQQLADALRQQELRSARREFLLRLRERSGVTIFLRPPSVNVGFDRARVRGNPRASVTIVEFSDFQCPFCRRAQPTLRALLEKYDGQIRHAFRDFPIDEIHPRAARAAEAARCAAERNKFWDYHALLFEHFNQVDDQTLLAHARAVGLPETEFKTCLDSGKYSAAVRADLEAGLRAGVQGTPAFFINGILLSGAQPIEAFERIIEDELSSRR